MKVLEIRPQRLTLLCNCISLDTVTLEPSCSATHFVRVNQPDKLITPIIPKHLTCLNYSKI